MGRKKKTNIKDLIEDIEVVKHKDSKGREKVTSEAVIAKEHLMAAASDIADALIAMAMTPNPKQEQAAEYCLDRVMGKPTATVDLGEDNKIQLVIDDSLQKFAK